MEQQPKTKPFYCGVPSEYITETKHLAAKTPYDIILICAAYAKRERFAKKQELGYVLHCHTKGPGSARLEPGKAINL